MCDAANSASPVTFNFAGNVLTGATTSFSAIPLSGAGRRVDARDLSDDVRDVLTATGQPPLAPGATVTARTRYKVGTDGELVVTDRKITISTEEQASASDADGRRSSRRAFERDSQQTLANLAKPQPQLSPSDELALFGEGEAFESVTEPPLVSRIVTGQATAEDGSSIPVDIIRPGAEAALQTLKSLSAQVQASAAARYARNSDAVFGVSSLTQFAA